MNRPHLTFQNEKSAPTAGILSCFRRNCFNQMRKPRITFGVFSRDSVVAPPKNNVFWKLNATECFFQRVSAIRTGRFAVNMTAVKCYCKSMKGRAMRWFDGNPRIGYNRRPKGFAYGERGFYCQSCGERFENRMTQAARIVKMSPRHPASFKPETITIDLRVLMGIYDEGWNREYFEMYAIERAQERTGRQTE